MDQLIYYKSEVFPKYWNLQIAANSSVKYQIGVPLPSYVKKVIGLMCVCSGVNMSNTALVSVANTGYYFISLKKQGGFPYQELRLDMLIADIETGANSDNSNRFLPVNIDNADIDLQSSFILNPSGISNALMFGFLYI